MLRTSYPDLSAANAPQRARGSQTKRGWTGLQGPVRDIVEPRTFDVRVLAGGAWPFLVGGVICLLNCDNERDLNLLNSPVSFGWPSAS